MSRLRNRIAFSAIHAGIVDQFNVGMYSAKVIDLYNKSRKYVCFIGAMNISQGLGYSDATVLREGDEVIFGVFPGSRLEGVVLARRPVISSVDKKHHVKARSKTRLERRTSFLSSDCYRRENSVYSQPLDDTRDTSTRRYMSNRPTDLVPGETGTLNQHRCGFIGGMYSFSVVGGGAHIRLFSLENRMRMVADSIVKYTMLGNENEWHNRRYLSHETAECLYQEERFGLSSQGQEAFDRDADYDKDGYFTRNKKPRQTLKPRLLNQTGYYGNLSTRYCLRPDPDFHEPRTLDDLPYDPGVARESIDPSGQYRLATTGMMGFERIGRIPVPVRMLYPWQKEAVEPKAEKLKPFEHNEKHPYYRQLELADRVAYDLKNSYARTDESDMEFHVPEEQDLENKLQDVYDPGFTNSETVKLQKYDKRRSGIWQGEDGSIIIRDAWGSEIVMIGGNIQLSCAGSVQTLPGKTALTIAGDDIVQKAQNSIDIESADKDVRLNAFKNVQVLAGVDEDHPGGITLESRGKAGPWEVNDSQGGEQLQTMGILLKAHDGAVVTDAQNMALKAEHILSVVAGSDRIPDSDGVVLVSAKNVMTHGSNVIATTDGSALVLTSTTSGLFGGTALLAGTDAAAAFQGDEYLVPLMLLPTDMNIAQDMLDGLQPITDVMTEEEKVSFGYDKDKLEKMSFRFRSSEECGTTRAWELSSSEKFTLYEPFWVQVKDKFETLEGAKTKDFEDHFELWYQRSEGCPWPGQQAIVDESAVYACIPSTGPFNLDSDGLNKPRSIVRNKTEGIDTVKLFPGYQVREE